MLTKEECIDRLREVLKPGDVVHCVLRHVSKSGMMRAISFLKIQDGETCCLDYWIGQALDYKRHPKKDGLKVSGCGMDMGFSVVYNLSATLFPNGFKCIGVRKRCPSNDHSNGDRNYRPHNHRAGGYALRHRWI